MTSITQTVIPAARSLKDFEQLMQAGMEYVVMLQIHLSQAKYVAGLAKQNGVKLLLHADLIQGLRPDEHGAQFLCQEVRPSGLISTHAQVVATARKRGLLGVQRIFLLDSQSLETSYRVIQSVQPDWIEVLPGVLTEVIREIATNTQTPVVAGGFIRTTDDVDRAIDAGAMAVTSSDKHLWEYKGGPSR